MFHTAIDTEARWTKSGRRGWVYSWKWHLASAVTSVWSPIAADLTTADIADNEVPLKLMADSPTKVRIVLANLHDDAPNVREVRA